MLQVQLTTSVNPVTLTFDGETSDFVIEAFGASNSVKAWLSLDPNLTAVTSNIIFKQFLATWLNNVGTVESVPLPAKSKLYVYVETASWVFVKTRTIDDSGETSAS